MEGGPMGGAREVVEAVARAIGISSGGGDNGQSWQWLWRQWCKEKGREMVFQTKI
ncbi:UNVERIFIED_CONTAM: hypothetical protein Slati_1166200 [Sesamum latifolium]|uniref:Uncharacterized protein n=1 Tax=Sesamum latifolium TaxID=2727402 RepID=A0AAW2XDP8_9LAMI